MKILATFKDFGGVGYNRILLPYCNLRERGYEVDLRMELAARWLKGFDVLVLQLEAHPQIRETAIAFQALGGKVIFEFDDDFRDIAPSNPAAQVYNQKHINAILDTMRIADVCTTTTPDLVEAYKDVHDRIFVCRNALDPQVWGGHIGRGPRPHEPGTPWRIGWCGSTSQHADDLALIAPAIEKLLLEREDVEFVMAGNDFTYVFPASIRPRVLYVGSSFDPDPTSPTGYRMIYQPGERLPSQKLPEVLDRMRIDIAVAPIVERPYSKGKSWVKILEYGGAGIPILASAYGPYYEYVQAYPGTVFVAFGVNDWYAQLSYMLSNPDAALSTALANRKAITENHIIGHRLDEWETALKAAVGA